MSHLLLCRLHLRSRVANLPAIKDVETETIPRNRAPIGRRNSPRAMQPLLRHDSHSPMPRQLHRSGRPATITGQHRASPSPGRQHRNGRKYRLRMATRALDMPQFQCRNPSRLRRTRRARASQRTTNTRQLVQSKWKGEPEAPPIFQALPVRIQFSESNLNASQADHPGRSTGPEEVCRCGENPIQRMGAGALFCLRRSADLLTV